MNSKEWVNLQLMERKSIKEITCKVGYVLACSFLALLLVIAVAVLVKTFQMDLKSGRPGLHKYLAAGYVAFFVLFLIPRVRNNTRWMMSFTHEFTHLVFALLFFRKIQRFKVDSKDSHVSFSGGWYGYIPITLAPYCVPLFTLAVIPWRYTTDPKYAVYLAIIDVIIGFTYAFHCCCWAKQIRLHQTDITGPGVVRSLLVITIFLILNFCLVVLLPSSGVEKAIARVFWTFPSEFVNESLKWITHFFS